MPKGSKGKKSRKRKADDGASSSNSKKQRLDPTQQADNPEEDEIMESPSQPVLSSSSVLSSLSSSSSSSVSSKTPKKIYNLKKEKMKLTTLQTKLANFRNGDGAGRDPQPKMSAEDEAAFQALIANSEFTAAQELPGYIDWQKKLATWKKDDGKKTEAKILADIKKQTNLIEKIENAIETRKNLVRFKKAKVFLEDKLRIYNKYANAFKDEDGNFWIRRAHLVYSQKPIVFVYADTMNDVFQHGNARTKNIIKKSKIRSFVEGNKKVKGEDGKMKTVTACGQVRVFPDTMNAFYNPILDNETFLADFIKTEEEVEGGESDAQAEDASEVDEPSSTSFIRQSSHLEG